MKEKKIRPTSRAIYKIFRFFAEIVFRGTKVERVEKIQKKGKIIVANHAQLRGPFIGELFLPENCYIWANGQMFHKKEVPDYAMEDFFPYKPKWMQPICRLASNIMAYLIPPIMENARAIPVYRDARIASTFRKSLKLLVEGKNILIFPECHEKNNNIVNRFQQNFVDIARLYNRRTGEDLAFVPMYIAPDLKRTFVGNEVMYDSAADPEMERERICQYLSDEITKMARELPVHIVIPFDNLRKKQYITNKDVDKLPG